MTYIVSESRGLDFERQLQEIGMALDERDRRAETQQILKAWPKWPEIQQTQDAFEIAKSFELDGPSKRLWHDIEMEHYCKMKKCNVKVYQNLINFKSTLLEKLAQLPNFLERVNKPELSIIQRMSAEQINLNYTDADIQAGRVTIGTGEKDHGVKWVPYWKDWWNTDQVTQDRIESIIDDLMVEFADEIGINSDEQDVWKNIFNQLFTLKIGMGLWWCLSSSGEFSHVGVNGFAVTGPRNRDNRSYFNSDYSGVWQRLHYRDDQSVPAFKN
jgi:hypothetical protein